jgi:hypothetical protein
MGLPPHIAFHQLRGLPGERPLVELAVLRLVRRHDELFDVLAGPTNGSASWYAYADKVRTEDVSENLSA